jgi:hypothetical protein
MMVTAKQQHDRKIEAKKNKKKKTKKQKPQNSLQK